MSDAPQDPFLAQLQKELAQDPAATTRPLPHALELEQSVLGALMMNNDLCDRVAAIVAARHFYSELHGRIFEAIATLVAEGRSADPVSLGVHLGRDEGLANAGGGVYLKRLVEECPTVVPVTDYARTIHDLALRRGLIALGEDMIEAAHQSHFEASPKEQIEAAERELYALAEQGRFGRGFVSMRESLASALAAAERAFKRRSQTTGIPTGFRLLDFMLGGLQNSDLVIVAGRPGMGKTSFATNIAVHAAKARLNVPADGAGVAFFSLEMSHVQLSTRIISEVAQVPSEKIRRGKIDERELVALADATALIADMPLYIDDSPGLSMAQIAARARRLKRDKAKGLGLIVVDYLQLIEASGSRRAENRVQEVTEITKGLKSLAKELDLPVMALSQLSRGVDSRDDKRPVLSDLRESGSIEQDADVVMFLYREEYYLKTREPDPLSDPKAHAEWFGKFDRVKGRGEVLIEKHRHGPTGKVDLAFIGEYTRYDNLPDPRDLAHAPG